MTAVVRDAGDLKRLGWKFDSLFPTTTAVGAAFQTPKPNMAVKLINTNQGAVTCKVSATVPDERWWAPWSDNDDTSKTVTLSRPGSVLFVIFSTAVNDPPVEWNVEFEVKGGNDIHVEILARR